MRGGAQAENNVLPIGMEMFTAPQAIHGSAGKPMAGVRNLLLKGKDAGRKRVHQAHNVRSHAGSEWAVSVPGATVGP